MIYFIHAPEAKALKIGISNDPWRRLEMLQTGCPCDLILLATIEGDAAIERSLHERFAMYRKRSRAEWFDYAQPLQDYVATLPPVEQPMPYQSVLRPICEAGGIGKSYASSILNGKVKPPLPLMFQLFKNAGWKHPDLSHMSDETLLDLAEKVPYRRKGSPRQEAA